MTLRLTWKTVVAVAFLFAAMLPVAASEAALEPGEKAPLIELPDADGTVQRIDPATSNTYLLLFLKPGDRYGQKALDALQFILEQHPELAAKYGKYIIVSRLYLEKELGALDLTVPKGWTVLYDREDKTYHEYRTVATPTVVVTAEGVAKGVHPGFDPNLPQAVRIALAEAADFELPRAVTEAPVAPSLQLQMARRMAQRGLWERARKYYEQAAQENALSPEVRLEYAEVLVELEEWDAALSELESLPVAEVEAEKHEEVRMRALKREPRGDGTAPQVNR